MFPWPFPYVVYCLSCLSGEESISGSRSSTAHQHMSLQMTTAHSMPSCFPSLCTATPSTTLCCHSVLSNIAQSSEEGMLRCLKGSTIGGMFAQRAPGACPAHYLCIRYPISSPKFIPT